MQVKISFNDTDLLGEMKSPWTFSLAGKTLEKPSQCAHDGDG